jgi:hypothetical protein
MSAIDGLGVKFAQPDHLAAVEQRAVQRHKQAVHMEDRQRMDQHVTPAFRPSPSSPSAPGALLSRLRG